MYGYWKYAYMTLNNIEGIKEGSKEDLLVEILMDNKSAVDMSISFKDTKNACHIHRGFHFVKLGVEQLWHKLIWIWTIGQNGILYSVIGKLWNISQGTAYSYFSIKEYLREDTHMNIMPDFVCKICSFLLMIN